MGRGPREIKLIDMKVMNPKKFDGKPDSPYRAWAKSVRAYCNASQPGFRKFLRWVEVQTSPIDLYLVRAFDWEQKEAAGDALFNFLQLHTTDDAQQLVELQDENGPEAWRQLSIRYDPIGESYVFDRCLRSWKFLVASSSPSCRVQSPVGNVVCASSPRRQAVRLSLRSGNFPFSSR